MAKSNRPARGGASRKDGSIYLDELLNRYLVAIGSRRSSLPADELRQFAFLTLHKLIKRYGLKSFDPQFIWDRIALGDYHILLTPDAPEHLDPKRPAKELVISLNSVRHPKSLAAMTFKQLLSDEAERNESDTGREIGLTDEAEHVPAPGGDWLAAEELVDRALSEMTPRDAKLVELFITGYSVADLSVMTGLREPSIYTIYGKFRKRLRELLGVPAHRTYSGLKKGVVKPKRG